MSERSSYAEGTPCWVELQTPDQSAARAFYTVLFGWAWEDRPLMEGTTYSIATLRGHHVAAVTPPPAGSLPADTPPRWNTFLAVEDADAAAAKVEPSGGELLLPAFDILDSGRLALVADPTGAEACLWEGRAHIGATLVNEAGTLIWNELVTDRPDDALAFYRAVVGLGSTVMPLPGAGDYTVLQVDGDGVGGCIAPPRPEVLNHWHVYFCADETDATVDKAVEHGGALMADPYDLPAIGRIAVLSDPDGGVFSVLQPEPAP